MSLKKLSLGKMSKSPFVSLDHHYLTKSFDFAVIVLHTHTHTHLRTKKKFDATSFARGGH